MKSNWQADFFHGVALEFWRRAISPEQTRKEVDFLAKNFGDAPRIHLLDVPCGNGRHAVELANRGCIVTGVDSSREFLDEARARDPQVHWIAGDMGDLGSLVSPASFDGAYCCGNSFGYLDASRARRFLATIAVALKPGGRFVMDTGMAAESILPGLGKGRLHRLGDIVVYSENRYDARDSRLDIDYTFIQNGVVETRPSSSYCFTCAEICRMHGDAGLDVLDLQGWYDGQPYQLGSGGLVVVSRKL